MDIQEYHKMHAQERDHWWFQGRRRVILTMIQETLPTVTTDNERKGPFLDIGCGTGMLLDDLSVLGSSVGLDFSPVALSYCRKRKLDKLARADATYIPVKDNSVQLITALDMIEHVKNDVLLMSEIARVLRPGGVAVMSVPAHPKLWSPHDVALHHYRRYLKDEFLKLVIDSGLTPLRYSYSMLTAFIPALVYRKARRLFPVKPSHEKTDLFPIPRCLNSLLKAAVDAEAQYLRRRNLPMGLSLLCIAVKPEKPPSVVEN